MAELPRILGERSGVGSRLELSMHCFASTVALFGHFYGYNGVFRRAAQAYNVIFPWFEISFLLAVPYVTSHIGVRICVRPFSN